MGYRITPRKPGGQLYTSERLSVQSTEEPPTFDHVRRSLRQLGHLNGLVYLVSAIPTDVVVRALPEYHVISKDTILGDTTSRYPFEVSAAIDYGVAVRAPLYLGIGLASSFDAFVAAERRATGLTPLHHLAEGEPCGIGNRTRARVVARSAPGAKHA